MLRYAWRKPSFNEENDGIVYTGAAAVGFAALENILYVARLGLASGVARAFTAVLMGLAVDRAWFASTRAARVRPGLALPWSV